MGQSWGHEAFLSCAKTAKKVIFKSLVLEQRLHCVMREVLLSYHKWLSDCLSPLILTGYNRQSCYVTALATSPFLSWPRLHVAASFSSKLCNGSFISLLCSGMFIHSLLLLCSSHELLSNLFFLLSLPCCDLCHVSFHFTMLDLQTFNAFRTNFSSRLTVLQSNMREMYFTLFCFRIKDLPHQRTVKQRRTESSCGLL